MSIQGKSVLAIIPAREGSRRVPLKNITLYRGKPLIQHAIDHAQGSKYIDTIVVSSDSQAILIYAKPPVIALQRPAHIACDNATSEAVIVHTLYATNPLADPCVPLHDYFILLQPTSPLRTPEDIDACLELALKSHGRAVTVNESGLLNGAAYACETTKFLATLSIGAPARYTMPNSRSLDIDTPEDFLKP